jgi:hypothetical protein
MVMTFSVSGAATHRGSESAIWRAPRTEAECLAPITGEGKTAVNQAGRPDGPTAAQTQSGDRLRGLAGPACGKRSGSRGLLRVAARGLTAIVKPIRYPQRAHLPNMAAS